ncbi:MAG: Uma2 family endonuclease [Methylococcales bacterium]
MLAKQVKPLLSEDDYLEMERVSKIRHEYVDGYIFAMAGGSRSHNKIAMNTGSALHQHVKGTACDVKLKIAHRRSYYYPDLMLGYSREETNEYFLMQPCLIIEVLSKSTATTDRREKLIAYQSIPSVREYCLIAQNTYRIERYHRLDEAGLWHTRCMKKAIVCSFPVLIIHLAWLTFMLAF